MLRGYAQMLGTVLIMSAILGLVLGERSPEDLVHMGSGTLFLLAALHIGDIGSVQAVVIGVGLAYLAVGIAGFFAPTLFGLLAVGYTTVERVFHTVLGVVTLAAGFNSGRESVAAHSYRRMTASRSLVRP